MNHVTPVSSLRRGALIAGAALLTSAIGARAQTPEWPTRPVKVVVPVPPGGPSDLFARLFTEQFAKTFGQPFIVENKAGANGLIANDAVAKAAPDGYTLLFSYAAAIAINHALLPNPPYDALKDLQPIAQIGRSGTLLAVAPDFPARNIAEFVSHVRENPGKYVYASWGQGSGGHLSMESLKAQAGLRIDHVPYKAMGQILTDLQGGVIRVAFVDPFTTIALIRAGRIRPLVLSGTRRGPQLPDVPTMTEAGFPFNADAWFGMFAPAGTPMPIVQRMNEAVNTALGLPAIEARFTSLNMPEAPRKSVEQFARTVRDDIATWGDIVRKANVEPQ